MWIDYFSVVVNALKAGGVKLYSIEGYRLHTMSTERQAVAQEILRMMHGRPSLYLLPYHQKQQLAQLAAETHSRDGNRWKFTISEVT